MKSLGLKHQSPSILLLFFLFGTVSCEPACELDFPSGQIVEVGSGSLTHSKGKFQWDLCKGVEECSGAPICLTPEKSDPVSCGTRPMNFHESRGEATIIFEEGDSVGCEGKKRKSTVKMKCSKREKIRILEEKKCQYELTLSSLDYCSPSATIFDENFSYKGVEVSPELTRIIEKQKSRDLVDQARVVDRGGRREKLEKKREELRRHRRAFENKKEDKNELNIVEKPNRKQELLQMIDDGHMMISKLKGKLKKE